MLKKDLRLLYRDKRARITPEAVRQQSEIIAGRLCGWLSSHPDIRCIHSFLPADGKKEVDTFVILREVRRVFPLIRIVVPKISKGERALSHHLFESATVLAANRWGIPEPTGPGEVPVADIDAVILPLLIFDQSGHRVGYGGGFYDTFLAACRDDTLKIGLCFFDPVETISDTGPHDIRMDLCITPGHIWNFAGQGTLGVPGLWD